MKLLSGTANPNLTRQIANALKAPLISREINYFSNGEKRLRILDDVKGENVTLVQSFVNPADELIIETLLMIDALERMGARHINLVIPWMGYSLQDKVFQTGEPISAKVIANLLSNSYVKRTFLMDLHNDSIPAFFNMPTHYLSTARLFEEYVVKQFDLKQAVVVSPDFGGLKRARHFANHLQLPLANIDKNRDLVTGKVTALGIHGDVKNKIALVLDDVIVSGSTVIEAAECLKEAGATSVIFVASHGLLTHGATDKIQNSLVDQVVITNSIEHSNLPKKFIVQDVSSVFAKSLANWL
ncbi:MAG TPA: ribose-phosphate pyrophosphokinase [Candidatus Woesebacteria bacterium]|nr:ribose-phosphate pyrophosphokinase [Candidatus Woesebacteria bacterium]